MLQPVLRHLRANAVAYVALFIALGGTAYAAGLPAGSVGTKQLRNGAVTSQKVAKNTTVPNASNLGGLAPSAFQRRLAKGGCRSGSAIQSVSANGALLCGSIVSPEIGGTGNVKISPSTSEFLAPEGLSTPSTSADDVTLGTPNSSFTASTLFVTVSAPPGAGNEWLFTLEINGSTTGAPECLIADLDKFCTNQTDDSPLVPPGAQIVIKAQAFHGTPTPASATFGWLLSPA